MDTLPEKRCTKCDITKILDEFGTDRSRHDGKHSQCKACRTQHSATSYAADPEKHRAKSARWRTRHPAKVQKYQDGYKPRKKQLRRQRYVENREAVLAQNAAWYTANKDQRKLSMADWEERNKDNRKEQRATRYLENPEKMRASRQAWDAAHPGYGAVKWERRRSRQAGAALNDLSEAQFEELKAAWNYRCAYCPDSCRECKKKTHDLHQDHVEPVANGGNYTVQNIVPCCQRCNSQKGAGPPLKAVQLSLLTEAPPRKMRKKRS